MKVRLISVNGGLPLALLGVKVSQGRLHERDADYYLREYPRVKGEVLRKWVVGASRSFPSVLEHVVFTFLIEGVSRVTTHQLVRHRLASYTQESQRFSESYMRVAVEGARKWLEERDLLKSFDGFTDPASILECFLLFADDEAVIKVCEKAFVIPQIGDARATVARSLLRSLVDYYMLVQGGVSVEDARYVVPQAIRSRVLMTVNLREFLHIVRLRRSSKAQWEIRELVERMVDEVRKVIPCIEELIDAGNE